ncbi:MAG: cytochrome c oxidase accessory protein CcoG [Deltaproteobacteria bacterium]|nr:cytochrome c oxidase accessory protein CcoG [Deltaproteobacteria bacterium]
MSEPLPTGTGQTHAPTIHPDGKRRWIYPDRRKGHYSAKRQKLAFLLILIYLCVPFLSFNGLPLLRIDMMSQVISFFGQSFRFRDASYLFFLFVIPALTLFLVTSVKGRIWCGYACPQTVWTDWVIRPIEELLEGPAARRKVTDSRPFSFGIALRKLSKHVIFFILASFLSHVLLAYFVDPVLLLSWLSSSPTEHWGTFLAVLSVTFIMYLDFAWFREQFCAFLCPYARFQSVMMDDHTPVVSYDSRRGEPRGRRGAAKGDCIDCQLCVRVCPTGIDIRKGLQLECIQCARCADACNMVMKNLGRSSDLIREISSAGDQGKQKDRLLTNLSRPKNLVFLILLMLFTTLFIWRLAHRQAVEVSLTRQAGPAYSRLDDGSYANLFHLHLSNTENKDQNIQLNSMTEGIRLLCSGCQIPLKAFEEKKFSILVIADSPGHKIVHVQFLPGEQLLEIPMILPDQS